MLVPEVDPEDVFLVSVLLEDRLQTLLKPINCGLTCAEDGESWQLKKRSYLKEIILKIIKYFLTLLKFGAPSVLGAPSASLSMPSKASVIALRSAMGGTILSLSLTEYH